MPDKTSEIKIKYKTNFLFFRWLPAVKSNENQNISYKHQSKPVFPYQMSQLQHLCTEQKKWIDFLKKKRELNHFNCRRLLWFSQWNLNWMQPKFVAADQTRFCAHYDDIVNKEHLQMTSMMQRANHTFIGYKRVFGSTNNNNTVFFLNKKSATLDINLKRSRVLIKDKCFKMGWSKKFAFTKEESLLPFSLDVNSIWIIAALLHFVHRQHIFLFFFCRLITMNYE